jgi:hypothetical protein
MMTFLLITEGFLDNTPYTRFPFPHVKLIAKSNKEQESCDQGECQPFGGLKV